MESLAEVVENNPDHIIPAIIDGFRTPPLPIQKSMFTKSLLGCVGSHLIPFKLACTTSSKLVHKGAFCCDKP
jgi:hypothetical protein